MRIHNYLLLLSLVSACPGRPHFVDTAGWLISVDTGEAAGCICERTEKPSSEADSETWEGFQ